MRLATSVAMVLAALAAPACNTPRGAATPGSRTGAVTLTVIGTNDLHGHLEALPRFAGYLKLIRATRAADGGGVLLLDGGDMFQGTLASNLGEGAAVVDGYRALGYDAVTIGNHEFDFGPLGPLSVPKAPTDDAQGALKARAKDAGFPFLMANVVDATSGQAPAWPNVTPTLIKDVAGVKVGLIGITTEDTPMTTMGANFRGLAMRPLADVVRARATELRGAGATVVIVLAHAGAECPGDGAGDPKDLTGCTLDDEAFQLADALATDGKPAVDAIVAGHTHAPVAKVAHGIAIIESWSYGRGFGRVDLTVDRATGAVTATQVHDAFTMCTKKEDPCVLRPYEGHEVAPDPAIEAVLAPHLARAQAQADDPLGVTLSAPIKRAHRTESALGNLFTDLMLASIPGADVAITNGGGLRADLPAGPLTYGELFEASPFDNRFAVAPQTGAQIAALFVDVLGRDGGFVSVAGLHVKARCAGKQLAVDLTRPDGRPIQPTDTLTLLTNEFLAGGGDGRFRGTKFELRDLLIREEMADRLRERKGQTITPESLTRPRRVEYKGDRPVRCE